MCKILLNSLKSCQKFAKLGENFSNSTNYYQILKVIQNSKAQV